MAAATAAGAAEAVAVAPPSPQKVGSAFVAQYYNILHHSPSLVHRFYQDVSKLGRPEDDGTTSITTTMTAINEKVLSLNYDEYKAEIKSVDAQESLGSGVHVLVTGYMTGKDNIERNFVQSFFLAPQERGGYFVLNDMFQYVDKVSIPEGKSQVLPVEVEIPITTEQVITEAAPTPVEDDHITEQTNGVVEEANREVLILSENGKIVDAKEEQEEEPVAEVVNAVQDDSQLVAESNVKTEDAPKKSYASIVKDLKGNSLPFSSPPPAPRKTPTKSQEQKVNHAPPTVSSTEVSGAPESGKSQDGEAEGYSIYIKGLPYDATPALLEDEFKKFGTIKNGGIQVRSKQGFCFGFVEFEDASAVHNAVKASPISLGGRPAVIEEKRSTNSRVNNRGRFPAGRGVGFRNEAGFRNEGMRGRGNYGGGRGYNRAEFNGRNEFSNNRGNNRGGSSNRGGGDGFQRTENVSANGGRVTRGGGLSGTGAAKNLAPRVPASA